MTSQEPLSGACLSCFDDLDEENAVEFVDGTVSTLEKKFMKDCVDVDCERTMRALMERGPPVFISDPYAFPDSDGREIRWLKRYSEEQIFEAKLDGAVTGEERQALWEHLKGFMVEKKIL